MGTVGRVAQAGVNPTTFLRSWNFSELPPEERRKFYRESPRPDGTLLREYDIFAIDREIEYLNTVAAARTSVHSTRS